MIVMDSVYVLVCVHVGIGSKEGGNINFAFIIQSKQKVEHWATWLILPVVICLSQKLSHASLSISIYTARLRMAHYISYRLKDGY